MAARRRSQDKVLSGCCTICPKLRQIPSWIDAQQTRANPQQFCRLFPRELRAAHDYRRTNKPVGDFFIGVLLTRSMTKPITHNLETTAFG